MKKILFLPLKKKWYEMIESGVKTEEYRELKEHWIKRLFKVIDLHHTHYEQICGECARFYANNVELMKMDFEIGGFQPKDFTHIKFSYGYTKRTMTFKCKGIRIGKGRLEWGAPDKEVFIIELGEKL